MAKEPGGKIDDFRTHTTGLIACSGLSTYCVNMSRKCVAYEISRIVTVIVMPCSLVAVTVAVGRNIGWLEFAGLENDGVEQEQTYTLHTIKNFNVYDM